MSHTTASEMRLPAAHVGPILPSVSEEGNLWPPSGAGRFHSLPFCALHAEGTTQVHDTDISQRLTKLPIQHLHAALMSSDILCTGLRQ